MDRKTAGKIFSKLTSMQRKKNVTARSHDEPPPRYQFPKKDGADLHQRAAKLRQGGQHAHLRHAGVQKDGEGVEKVVVTCRHRGRGQCVLLRVGQGLSQFRVGPANDAPLASDDILRRTL